MNEQKKKIPWWVALLQLVPAVIDSITKLVKEAKAKKKLKQDERHAELVSASEEDKTLKQVQGDEYPETGPETYNKN